MFLRRAALHGEIIQNAEAAAEAKRWLYAARAPIYKQLAGVQLWVMQPLCHDAVKIVSCGGVCRRGLQLGNQQRSSGSDDVGTPQAVGLQDSLHGCAVTSRNIKDRFARPNAMADKLRLRSGSGLDGLDRRDNNRFRFRIYRQFQPVTGGDKSCFRVQSMIPGQKLLLRKALGFGQRRDGGRFFNLDLMNHQR